MRFHYGNVRCTVNMPCACVTVLCASTQVLFLYFQHREKHRITEFTMNGSSFRGGICVGVLAEPRIYVGLGGERGGWKDRRPQGFAACWGLLHVQCVSVSTTKRHFRTKGKQAAKKLQRSRGCKTFVCPYFHCPVFFRIGATARFW